MNRTKNPATKDPHRQVTDQRQPRPNPIEMILGRQLGLEDVVWFVPLVYGGGAYLAWMLYKELRS